MTYIEVERRAVWHKVVGRGNDSVVLLHGGMSDGTSFDTWLPAFTDAGYRVYVPDRRGHGQTPDVDERLSYEAMATDAVDYLIQAVKRPAALIGWSDGAVVAMLAAMRRPDLVRRLVVVGQYFDPSGRVPSSATDALLTHPDVKDYLRRSYRWPDRFDGFYGKCVRMWAAEPDIDRVAIAGLRTPTLVLQGDRDDVQLMHSADVASALPGGRLAVLPGTHLLPIENPDLVTRTVIWFLRQEGCS